MIRSATVPADREAFSALVSVEYRLRNLTADQSGRIFGSQGKGLYRIGDEGDRVVPVARFDDIVQGVHATMTGQLVVSVDRDPVDPTSPCTIYLIDPESGSSRVIKRIESASALWWSIASDANGAIYIGEYGPTIAGVSRNVWKSSDEGHSWDVVFQAPSREGVHIHRVAVDPFTQDLWITVGDGRDNRGIFRSRDGGRAFKRELDSQATAVAFTEDAIYWGEDHRKSGRITRLDRASGEAREVLRAAHAGPYGGSIYDMTVAADGTVYAPTMKYPLQGHTATLWRGRNEAWDLVAELPVGFRGAVNGETIAGPDRNGWIFMTGYKVRHRPNESGSTSVRELPGG